MNGCNLSKPPRDVPGLVSCQLLFGGALSQIGWLLFGFGAVFFWAFAMNSDLPTLLAFGGELEQRQGVATRWEKTRATEGGSKNRLGMPVYATHYSFKTPDGKEYSGVSYATGSYRPKGTAVTVEYPRGNPAMSRIQGTRRAVFGAWAGIMGLFPFAGLALAGVGLAKGTRARQLLANGKQGMGKLKSKAATNVQVNKQTVFKLTFEFAAEDGHSYEAVARTHKPHELEDEAQEPLLYDPADPRRSVMLDTLPGRPRIDEKGQLCTARPGTAWLVLVLPALSIAGNGLAAYFLSALP